MNATNKVQPFKFNINVAALRKTLTGGRQKMPKDFMADVHMPVPIGWSSNNALSDSPLHVVVTAHNKRLVNNYSGEAREVKSSRHRIFIQCDCGRLIPAGRVRQHRH
jgi:hypothetical protein